MRKVKWISLDHCHETHFEKHNTGISVRSACRSACHGCFPALSVALFPLGENAPFLPRHVSFRGGLTPDVTAGFQPFRAQIKEDRRAIIVNMREEGVEAVMAN